MADTSSLVASYYDANSSLEHSRLISNRLELAITLETILSSLPPTPKSLRIADIGGGTGRYAVELAKLGHKITLVDLSPSELALARQYAEDSAIPSSQISFHVADASKLLDDLPFLASQLGTFDAVLLLGPLYHLLNEHDRLSTLDQCGRLLKEGGTCYAAFLNTFGHLRGMVGKDLKRLTREKDFYESYLGDGEGRGRYTRREGVVSYHIHPSQIAGGFEKVKGLKMERLIACEGFLGAESAVRLNGLDEEDWKAWVGLMLRYAEDPCVIGSSEHLLAVSRKVGR